MKKFPILKNFKIFGIISILLCATGIVSLLALPFGVTLFNLDIDFVGGTEIEFHLGQSVTADMKDEIAELFEETTGTSASSVVEASSVNVIVRSVSIDTTKRADFIAAMNEKYDLTEDDLYGNTDVSASVGSDLKRAAFISAILAAVLMMIYISFRFTLTSGLAAVTCLVHDLLVMLSVFVIFQLPLNQDFIAAALTILGYSINASIIVFDRVRENQKISRKESFEEIAEKSIWQTMGRTINTTITTMMTVGMIFILGVPSLRDFTLPLMIGMLSGAYSSVFLASPLWSKYRKIAHKKAA